MKLSDSLFETFVIWTCNSFGFDFEKFQKVQKFQIAHLFEVSSESFK